MWRAACLALVMVVGCGRNVVDDTSQSGAQGLSGGDPGKGDPGKGDPGLDCKAIEEKAIICKNEGLDCTDVFDALSQCSVVSPTKYDSCEGYQILYKDCVVTHPNDPFCDEILKSFMVCASNCDK